ncbi:hypothetical protein [Paenibacillus glucanolyticus]|uniref:hypothetical protein n=1 Tax=Paenibacillus glucanolyticus TaxID=59843 RepID=UPI0030CC34B3
MYELDKSKILNVMRTNAGEVLKKIHDAKGKNQDKTKEMNRFLDELHSKVFEILSKEVDKSQLPECAFLVYYCWIIVSLECRNYLWNYESMDLSRRSGELWESLVKLCWTFPVKKNVKRFNAPSFEDVQKQIKKKFVKKLKDRGIPDDLVSEIYNDYDKIWSLLGESINLNSDELFETFDELDGEIFESETKHEKVIIDFKGSYGSNEKGNKERLLTVARVYDMLNHYELTDKPYRCMLAVRTVEDSGHNYLRQLENSGLWSVERGNEVYDMIHKYTGFNILKVIKKHDLSIVNDLDENTAKYMKSKRTSKQDKSFADHYLTWW